MESPLAAPVQPAPESPPQRELPPEAYKDVHIEPTIGQSPSKFVEPVITITEVRFTSLY